jgi:hypothetical protein
MDLSSRGSSLREEEGMKGSLVVLAALVAAVTLSSVAGAEPAATKQRVAINTTAESGGSFVLVPLRAGGLRRDSGEHGCAREKADRSVIREGQQAFLHEWSAWRFVGKRGTLVVRSQFAWVSAGDRYNVATGAWKVVRGTGQYAGITGNGRSAHVGTTSSWDARYEGLLVSP